MSALVFKLLCGHALADFALQSEWMAKAKNRHAVSPGYDEKLHGPKQAVWPYVLSAHALLHGLAVFWATGSVVLGIAETAAHWLIDFGKCERWYGIHADQAAHLACKGLWALLLIGGVP
jgi:hypothetical protein